ncbi:peptide chain release factor N(5)-glutamine methyltransferase [Xinfangfangia pollutisoli]|uniref:peptide chain release factor N(5)-glutamine methyltransferase n=1 Tax=Xinfangfangia pollutisoli TaxID=2865960 RepID=UPI001CD5D3B7|nr:peptide chain release factor N(5)-glutamine methyltransferase [Xinfangfangia pollutisoli]
MIAKAALAAALPRLRAAGVDDPARDARLLLAHALAVDPGRLTLVLADDLTPGQEAAYEAAIAARAARRPVAQIIGQRQFWGRSFQVTADTLDPRPDTETLIEAALSAPFDDLLDLGTGTGCILLTLLAERPAATGLGTDLSAPALAVAQENARRLGLADRTRLIQADWFSGIGGVFDLIVSNPPYIALAEMPDLAPEVRDHEPHSALTDGADGLEAYRRIAEGAPERLRPAGRILVEIGPSQGAAVAALFRGAGLSEVAILPDLDGRDRVVRAIRR